MHLFSPLQTKSYIQFLVKNKTNKKAKIVCNMEEDLVIQDQQKNQMTFNLRREIRETRF